MEIYHGLYGGREEKRATEKKGRQSLALSDAKERIRREGFCSLFSGDQSVATERESSEGAQPKPVEQPR